MKNRALWGLVSVLVSSGLIAWLLVRIDFGQVAELWRQSDKRFLWLALGLTALVPCLSAMRWCGVLRAQEGVDMPYPLALRAVLMANVLNSFLPSKGGELVKAAYLRKRGGLAQGVGSVILERLIDLLNLGVLGLAGYLVSGVSWGLAGGIFLIGGVLSVLFLVLLVPVERIRFPGGIARKLHDLATFFRVWLNSPAAVLQTVVSSLGVWSLAGLTVCCMVSAFGQPLSWAMTYALFPPCIIAGLMPFTVSGVGTRDAMFVSLLMQNGADLAGATMVALGYTVFAYWFLSLLSLPIVGVQLWHWFRLAGENSRGSRDQAQ